jgi:hypothetical protein
VPQKLPGEPTADDEPADTADKKPKPRAKAKKPGKRSRRK